MTARAVSQKEFLVFTLESAGARRSLSRYGYVELLLLVILLFGSIRFRLRNFPLERDEGEYAYAGQFSTPAGGRRPVTSIPMV